MNASRTLINESLLSLSSCIVISHAMRKTPSTPVTPNPSIMFCVRRNGTRSGTSKFLPLCAGVRERCTPCDHEDKTRPTFSNRQLKSTCTTSPVLVSSRMFSQCRSPSLVELVGNGALARKQMHDLPQDESDHRHHCCRSPIHQATRKPCRGLREGLHEPFVKHWR